MFTFSNVNGKFILQELCKGRGSLIYAKKNKWQEIVNSLNKMSKIPVWGQEQFRWVLR